MSRTLVEILRKTVIGLEESPAFPDDRARLENLRKHVVRVIAELEREKAERDALLSAGRRAMQGRP